MMQTLVGIALTVASLTAGSTPTPGDAPGPDRIAAPVVLVKSEIKTMPHFWAWASFPEMRCPAQAPYLEDRRYYERVTIPWGVEVRAFGGPEVDVATLTLYDGLRPVGITATTATNHAIGGGERSVQIIL